MKTLFSLSALLFAFSAHAANEECQIYKESLFAHKPLDGQLRQTFTNESNEGDHPGEYAKIFVCARADESLYVVVRDGFMGVFNPPQDVIRFYEEDTWNHYNVNTARISEGEAAASTLQLVTYGTHAHLNGNPDRMWVFSESPNEVGNMPLVQAVLVDHSANR